MAMEPDGKDFTVQYTTEAGGEWKTERVFADPAQAKEHADFLLHSTAKYASVRVIETKYFGWTRGMGGSWRSKIGDREEEGAF